jgi:hypothetical protein
MPKRSSTPALTLCAALVGTVPLAFFGPLALAKLLPVSDELRAVIALYLPLPLYALLAVLTVRARPSWAWAMNGLGAAACAWLAR